MGSVADKTRSLADICSFYFRRPLRSMEVVAWARQRNSSTMDLRTPWWNFLVIEEISRKMPAGARVFEYGGGGSTLWLHDRGARITTVEHNGTWAQLLQESLPAECEVLYSPAAPSGKIGSAVDKYEYFDDYVQTIAQFEDEEFDLVVVDGRARVDCVRAAARKIKSGGMLLLDDSDRARYSESAGILAGWSRSDYRGVKPGGGGTVTSTVWTKPQLA